MTVPSRTRFTSTILVAVLICTASVVSAQDFLESPPQEIDPCEAGPKKYRAGQFAESRALFLECLENEGDRVEILLPLAVMGVREDRVPEALEFSRRAVDIAPEDPEARYWYGRALLRGKRPEEAKRQWEEGLQLDLGHMGILEGLARLALTEGETAKAYQLLTQLQRQGLDEPWLDRLLADIAAGKALWGQALGHLEQAMAVEGATLTDLLTCAELSILAGRKPEAVEYCRQAVKLEPGAASYGALGQAYFSVDEMDSALVYLRRAVEQDPKEPRYRFNLANALEITRQWEEAGAQFEAFLAMAPDDAVGHFNYGIHLDKTGRSSEAIRSIRQAIALDPDMLSARVVLAQILEEQGQWDAALAEVAQLRRLDPANAAELAEWTARITDAREATVGARVEGRIHLLHIILPSEELVAEVMAELEKGEDFAGLAVRFSRGAAAAKGGDIGWMDPDEMVEPLRSALVALAINEISPPLEAGGLFHIFKRVP